MGAVLGWVGVGPRWLGGLGLLGREGATPQLIHPTVTVDASAS